MRRCFSLFSLVLALLAALVLTTEGTRLVAGYNEDFSKEDLGFEPEDAHALNKRVMLPMSKFAFLPDKIHLNLGQEGSTQPKRGSLSGGGGVGRLLKRRLLARPLQTPQVAPVDDDAGAIAREVWTSYLSRNKPYPYYIFKRKPGTTFYY